MWGGGLRSILLLSLVTRCLEIIAVCIWRMFVVMSVVIIIITYFSIALIYSSIGTCSVRCIKGGVFNKC